jgi:hypothetical protein
MGMASTSDAGRRPAFYSTASTCASGGGEAGSASPTLEIIPIVPTRETGQIARMTAPHEFSRQIRNGWRPALSDRPLVRTLPRAAIAHRATADRDAAHFLPLHHLPERLACRRISGLLALGRIDSAKADACAISLLAKIEGIPVDHARGACARDTGSPLRYPRIESRGGSEESEERQ